VKAVFARYDELTKGTVTAIEQNKLGSKVAAYGIDILDADIELMTKKDSPWRATVWGQPAKRDYKAASATLQRFVQCRACASRRSTCKPAPDEPGRTVAS
jgi:ABC-type xylose transport system substrate-binding protein